ncbi:MAG: O-antigen ligase family protein [Spirochaetia bacterium]|nr:O-antigen ligase family protein [Spirochaetia bacterium]
MVNYLKNTGSTKEIIQGILFTLFCFFASFSVSISQLCAALASLFWLSESLFDMKNYQKSKKLKTYFQETYKTIKEKDILQYVLAFIFYKFFHVLISSNVQKEFATTKELLLLLVFFTLLFSLKNDKWVFISIIALLLGAFITSVYNLNKLIIEEKSLFDIRAAALDNTNSLTYTGTMAFIFFLGLGYSIKSFIEEKNKNTLLLSILTFFAFIGFILSGSKGGFISLGLTFVFLCALFLRKKFIFVLPFLMVIPVYAYKYITPINVAVNDVLSKQQGQSGTVNERIDLWKAGVLMWIDHPLLGTGEADYMNLYHKYKMKGAQSVAAKGSHMHNDYLDILVRFGSIGFTILLMFYFYPIIIFLQKMKIIFASKQKYILIFSTAAVVMISFMSLTQCHFRDDEVQILLWLTLGIFFREINKIDNKK